MTVNLPVEVQYDLPKNITPGTTNTLIQLLPSNGASFGLNGGGSVIQFQVPAVNFMDGQSLYIKYTWTATSTGESQILGCPVFSPFARSTILLGSQVVENINNLNQIEHFLSNVNLNPSQKFGLQSQYGYCNSSATAYQVGNMQSLNGGVIPAGGTGTWSGFLNNMLTNADRLIPLCSMPAMTVQFTLDSIANIFAPVATAVTGDLNTGVLSQAACVRPSEFTLTNVTLAYNMVSFNDEVTSMILKNDKLFLKSCSWNNSQQFIGTGTSGAIDLVYNQRLASIRSLILLTSSNMPNGIFDSINVCGDGDVQFYVSGKAYPQKGIGAGDVLPNLRKVIGSMGDKHTSFSIDTKEMSFTAQQLTTLTSREIPSKFYVSTNLSILPFSPVLLSGVSSANSSVNVRMNISTATVKPVNASLLLYYDLIIEIDTATRTASVKQ